MVYYSTAHAFLEENILQKFKKYLKKPVIFLKKDFYSILQSRSHRPRSRSTEWIQIKGRNKQKNAFA